MLIDLSERKIKEIKLLVYKRIKQQPPNYYTIMNAIMDDLNEVYPEVEVVEVE